MEELHGLVVKVQIFGKSPVLFLLLLSTLISALCKVSFVCFFPILFRFLRIVLWLRIWSVLVKAPCVLQKNKYSTVVCWYVLLMTYQSS